MRRHAGAKIISLSAVVAGLGLSLVVIGLVGFLIASVPWLARFFVIFGTAMIGLGLILAAIIDVILKSGERRRD